MRRSTEVRSPPAGARDRFATRDPRMAAWLVLIAVAVVLPGAGWVALAYGAVYVGYPAARSLFRTRGRGDVRASTPAVWGTLLALGGASFAAVPDGGPAWRAAAGVASGTGLVLAVHWAVTRRCAQQRGRA